MNYVPAFLALLIIFQDPRTSVFSRLEVPWETRGSRFRPVDLSWWLTSGRLSGKVQTSTPNSSTLTPYYLKSYSLQGSGFRF